MAVESSHGPGSGAARGRHRSSDPGVRYGRERLAGRGLRFEARFRGALTKSAMSGVDPPQRIGSGVMTCPVAVAVGFSVAGCCRERQSPEPQALEGALHLHGCPGALAGGGLHSGRL